MTLKVFKSGVAKLCGPIHVARSGVWKVVSSIRIWKVIGGIGAWHEFYVAGASPVSPPPVVVPPTPAPVTLTVTAAPTTLSGTRVGAGTVYTNTATISVSGGTGPYTYTYSIVSFSGLIAPSRYDHGAGHENEAQFSRAMSGTVPETQTARIKCLVQDSLGNKGSCLIDTTYYTTNTANTGGSGWVNQPPAEPGGGLGSGGDTP